MVACRVSSVVSMSLHSCHCRFRQAKRYNKLDCAAGDEDAELCSDASHFLGEVGHSRARRSARVAPPGCAPSCHLSRTDQPLGDCRAEEAWAYNANAHKGVGSSPAASERATAPRFDKIGHFTESEVNEGTKGTFWRFE